MERGDPPALNRTYNSQLLMVSQLLMRGFSTAPQASDRQNVTRPQRLASIGTAMG